MLSTPWNFFTVTPQQFLGAKETKLPIYRGVVLGFENQVLAIEYFRAWVVALWIGAFIRSACAATNFRGSKGPRPLAGFLSPISFSGEKEMGPSETSFVLRRNPSG
jgi:hypothetical protein